MKTTLTVLERTGVHVVNEEARALVSHQPEAMDDSVDTTLRQLSNMV